MEYAKLGQSELQVSTIAFGAWAIGGWMWGGADDKDALNAISAGLDYGITSIDTAPVYGFGHSEKLVGKAIKGKRDKVQIFTKYGLRWDSADGVFYFESKNNEGKTVNIHRFAGKESVIKECEESLKRLGTDYIDLYQIHWPDPSTPVNETMEALDMLIQQGKVRYAGVCNYDVKELSKATENLHILSDQVPYSMLRRDIEKELVPYCVEHNIDIIAYSPLQRGVLTGKIKPGHVFNDGDTRPSTPYYSNENLEKIQHFLNTINPIAKKNDATLSQLVINWTTRQKGIICTLVGARNVQQVIENAQSLEFELPDAELQFINDQIENLELAT